ncbi:hypothetical protein BGY98DRAFT_933733 [Russula aff. rugulosa BPL654]|nr:hypothetical protein BGY98DRAFT_933733 [Russula aff. rugulosa BPL654]
MSNQHRTAFDLAVPSYSTFTKTRHSAWPGLTWQVGALITTRLIKALRVTRLNFESTSVTVEFNGDGGESAGDGGGASGGGPVVVVTGAVASSRWCKAPGPETVVVFQSTWSTIIILSNGLTRDNATNGHAVMHLVCRAQMIARYARTIDRFPYAVARISGKRGCSPDITECFTFYRQTVPVISAQFSKSQDDIQNSQRTTGFQCRRDVLP